ncbi:hypothetical protein Q4575_19490 [Psychrosphaera sp. 1_MG-2023]|uniref:hypothetical protein n=1 Tax=Psychrosphaera sp. 1_MG-2023 TaxID=3062643 RepID=UPI0026E3E8A6|nr:hypothetical protein [Psychrosphaera sp. 1_MG-2023]MDO6721592.1 hypothetical protein [Psychrosphaera sp. 1_MG-2023]
MKISTLLYLFLLSGCAATDISKSNVASDIVGKCYEFTEQGKLLRVEGSDKERVMKFTLSYLFLTSESQNHHLKNNDGELVTSLELGTKIKITKVIDYPYGSAGRCWVIKAELLGFDTKGESVEIPSCWVWDEPIWVTPMSPFMQAIDSNEQQKLRIATSVLAPSTCS